MPEYFINSKIISYSRINEFKPKASNVVCIRHPISKPIKNDIPENLPDLVVKAVKYKLSGPGLKARRKLDKIKDNNIGVEFNKLRQYKFNYFCIKVFANNLIQLC